MLGAELGETMRVLDHRCARLAFAAALIAAAGLAACGRKGALDPPPSAALPASEVPAGAEPNPFRVPGAQEQPAQPPTPTTTRKSFFLDWLLN
jgi:predicted small lipoprotein YifL